MSPALQIRLLGRLSVSFAGQPALGFRAARLQSLLAYLVLRSDTPQPRAQLAFTFWPDASESAARNNLRQLLHQLRQALPEPDLFVRADASTVHWPSGDHWTLDVVHFDRALRQATEAETVGDRARERASLERAVSLCGGPLLPSCYEDWIGPERDRLQHRCKEALRRLLTRIEEEREYANGIPYVRHWLEHDPLDERAYQWLIRMQALAGDRAGAIQAFRQCADMLRKELRAEPSAETKVAYERLVSGHDGVIAEKKRAPEVSPSLVGRQREWARLRSAWSEGTRERLHFALIAGEAASENLAWPRSFWALRRRRVSPRPGAEPTPRRGAFPSPRSANGCGAPPSVRTWPASRMCGSWRQRGSCPRSSPSAAICPGPRP